MAHIFKRQGKRGVRWTARVRLRGRQTARTFQTKGAAESRAREQEGAIERDEPHQVSARGGALFCDAIEAFRAHRTRVNRPPGKTFNNALTRLSKTLDVEPLSGMDVAFWRQHAVDRIAAGAGGATVASELTYVGSVLRHAAREGHAVVA